MHNKCLCCQYRLTNKKLDYVKGLGDFIFDVMTIKGITKEQKITKIVE